jgi:hypothetical protein
MQHIHSLTFLVAVEQLQMPRLTLRTEMLNIMLHNKNLDRIRVATTRQVLVVTIGKLRKSKLEISWTRVWRDAVTKLQKVNTLTPI